MQEKQPAYFTAYRSIKLTRDTQGVLVGEFHSNGGPLTFTASDHTDFVECFYRISQDRENKIVILTGTGGEFIPGIDFSSFGNVADPAVWSQAHDEGVQILENLANIRVPMIAAIEGRAHVHSEYALIADVIVAGEGATFNDVPHFAGGIVPGDGIFTAWSYRAGAGQGRSVSAGSTSADGADRLRMGSGRRSSAERQGTQPGAGIGRAVPEGSGSDAPKHARAFHPAFEGAHRARSWLWIVARRSIGGRPREINASQKSTCRSERKIRMRNLFREPQSAPSD